MTVTIKRGKNAIPYTEGAIFGLLSEFEDYLDTIQLGAWRPRYITLHHAGNPNLKTWGGWQKRPDPVTDAEWMGNLAGFYGRSAAQGGPSDGPWKSGPHFFITPTHYCGLSLPNARGVHARSFNAVSWGVEVVGDFDTEPFDGVIKTRTIDALAAMHLALGLQPDPFELKVRGLHFHRDDPLTSKSCPGRGIQKTPLVSAIKARMLDMAGGETPDDPVVEDQVGEKRMGRATVNNLNLRADASGKAPIVGVLNKADPVVVIGSAMNGETKWLRTPAGWVAARFIELQ